MMGAQLAFDFYGHQADPDEEAAEKAAVEAAYDALVQCQWVALDEAKQHGIYRLYASCPDNRVHVCICPACGVWEGNVWLLGNNHGISLHHFERRDDGTWDTGRYGSDWCLALELTASHTAGDYQLTERQNRMLAGLRDEVRARFDLVVAETREIIAARRSAGA